MYKQNTRRVNIKDWFSFTLRSEYIADLIRQKFHGLLVHIYILILPSTAAHKATIQHKTTSLFIFFQIQILQYPIPTPQYQKIN